MLRMFTNCAQWRKGMLTKQGSGGRGFAELPLWIVVYVFRWNMGHIPDLCFPCFYLSASCVCVVISLLARLVMSCCLFLCFVVVCPAVLGLFVWFCLLAWLVGWWPFCLPSRLFSCWPACLLAFLLAFVPVLFSCLILLAVLLAVLLSCLLACLLAFLLFLQTCLLPGRLAGFLSSFALRGMAAYEGRPKTPVFGFSSSPNREKQKLSKAVRAQGARKCGPRDAQGYSFEGFHVLMLPSFRKGGDIFLLYLCLSNQSDAKRSQSFCGHDFNNQQLTRQNPRKPRASRAQAARKPRASCAQAREAPARHLAMLSRMSVAARFKQWIGTRNMHFLSFRLCPSCVAEPAVLSVGSRVCCWH